MPRFAFAYTKKSDDRVRRVVFSAESFADAAREVESLRESGIEAVSLGEAESWSDWFSSPIRMIGVAALVLPMLILFLRNVSRTFVDSPAVAGFLTVVLVLSMGGGFVVAIRARQRLLAGGPLVGLARTMERMEQHRPPTDSAWYKVSIGLCLVSLGVQAFESLFTAPDDQIKNILSVAAFMCLAVSIVAMPSTKRRSA